MALPRIIQQVRALFSAFSGSNPDAATPEVGVLPIEKGGTGSAAANIALGKNAVGAFQNLMPFVTRDYQQPTIEEAVAHRPSILMFEGNFTTAGDKTETNAVTGITAQDANFLQFMPISQTTTIDPGAGSSSVRTGLSAPNNPAGLCPLDGALLVVYE